MKPVFSMQQHRRGSQSIEAADRGRQGRQQPLRLLRNVCPRMLALDSSCDQLAGADRAAGHLNQGPVNDAL